MILIVAILILTVLGASTAPNLQIQAFGAGLLALGGTEGPLFASTRGEAVTLDPEAWRSRAPYPTEADAFGPKLLVADSPGRLSRDPPGIIAVPDEPRSHGVEIHRASAGFLVRPHHTLCPAVHHPVPRCSTPVSRSARRHTIRRRLFGFPFDALFAMSSEGVLL